MHFSHPLGSSSPTWRRSASALGPLALTCGALALLVNSLENAPALAAAAGSSGPDADGDKLCDYQEQVLGTDPTRSDTDVDTWSDLEELARGSDPKDTWIVPQGNEPELGMIARDQNGVTTMSSLIFFPGGQVPTVRFELGIVLGGVKIPLPSGSYIPSTIVRLAATRTGALVVMVETSIPSSLIRALGSISVYSMVADPLNPGVGLTADVLNLFDFDGVIMAATLDNTGGGGSPPSGWGPGGLIYTPLQAGQDLPTSFNGDQICYQITEPIGVSGVSVLEEVESSFCEPAESYCSPADCAAAVGKILEIVDPTLLLGG